jgi:flagellar hook-length control protein FliK
VEVQVSQLQPTTDPRLLTDNAAQPSTSENFQKYLDEEQKRLAGLFSPFGLFDLSSLFNYAFTDQQLSGGTGNSAVPLFSDQAETPAEQTTSSDRSATQRLSQTTGNQLFSQIANQFIQNNPRASLQELLQQTGWLIPNIQNQPQFLTAQLDGKLLSKLDLQALVDKIVSQLKLVQDKGKAELTLGLRPENLGEIVLTITSRAGAIAIQIQANQETQKLLSNQLTELEEALRKVKVNLAELTITGPKEVHYHA